MGFDYYCMKCGKKLNNSNVLFDMQYLLLGEYNTNNKFNIIKFRMTEDEMKSLLAKNNKTDRCVLEFSDVLKYIANKNNLNDPRIENLTIKDIDDFGDAIFNGIVGTEQYVMPCTIEALIEKDTANQNILFAQDDVQEDLNKLKSQFINGNKIEFEFVIKTEEDNNKDKIIVGYQAKVGVNNVFENDKARVCPFCGETVFDLAGIAEHKMVAFIGYQTSGKTSTILALTDYALNYMTTGVVTERWGSSNTIDSISTLKHLSPSEKLKNDLKEYANGKHPKKTEANKKDDAYSSTFLIKNKKNYILSLVDLPGELCLDEGEIDKDKILNQFTIAVNCDAYISCFDTQMEADKKLNKNNSVANKINDICSWTDKVQKGRKDVNNVSTYVPTMLLFTKCKELEEGTKQPINKNFTPLEKTYFFYKEKYIIEQVRYYKAVCECFNDYGSLESSYQAMLRCSPYGYSEKQKEENNELVPQPKNIDKLMRWILSVAGIIPVKAKYSTIGGGNGISLSDYCLDRPQLRDENPVNIEESLARCALFENPGKYDRKWIEAYYSKPQQKKLIFEMMLNKNGNAR